MLWTVHICIKWKNYIIYSDNTNACKSSTAATQLPVAKDILIFPSKDAALNSSSHTSGSPMQQMIAYRLKILQVQTSMSVYTWWCCRWTWGSPRLSGLQDLDSVLTLVTIVSKTSYMLVNGERTSHFTQTALLPNIILIHYIQTSNYLPTSHLCNLCLLIYTTRSHIIFFDCFMITEVLLKLLFCLTEPSLFNCCTHCRAFFDASKDWLQCTFSYKQKTVDSLDFWKEKKKQKNILQYITLILQWYCNNTFV